MRFFPWLAGALLGGAVVAQGITLRPVRLNGIFDAAEARGDAELDIEAMPDRLSTLVTKLWAAENAAAELRGRRGTVRMLKGREMLIVQGEREHFDRFDEILTQLRRPEHPELRVQCTILTTTAELAQAHGLVRGKPKPVTVAEAGKILKQCTVAGGSLKNLRECGGLPLQPFGCAPRAQDKALPKYELTCQGVMLDASSAVFDIRLLAQPKQPGGRNAERIGETCSVGLGAGVMLASRPLRSPPAPAAAIVMWFRFVSANVPTKRRARK